MKYLLALSFGLLCLGVGRAPADQLTSTWIGEIGDWSDPAKWSPAQVPPTGSDILIDGGNAGMHSVVSLDIFAQIANLTIDADDQLRVTSWQSLLIDPDGATIMNAGSLVLDGAQAWLQIGGVAYLDGGGNVILAADPSAPDSTGIKGGAPASLLVVSADSTIRGAGAIRDLSLLNLGLIDATDFSGLFLAAQGYDQVVANRGTLRATGEGRLFVQADTLDNTGGTISARDPNAVVLLEGVTIEGGALTGAGLIQCDSYPTTLDGVTSSARLAVNSQLALSGTLVNSGTIHLEATYGGAFLSIIGDVVLSGHGQITASDEATHRVYGQQQPARLINVDNSICVHGAIEQLELVNQAQGLIETTSPEPEGLRISVSGGPAVTNAGILRARAGGALHLQGGTYENAGGTIAALDPNSLVILEGNTEIVGGTLDSSDNATIRTGSPLATLDGVTNLGALVVRDGGLELQGQVVNSGSIAADPDFNCGWLQIIGDVALTGAGSISGLRIMGLGPAPRLTNMSNHIRACSIQQLSLVNHDLIEADDTGLDLDPLYNGVFTNTGTLQARGNGADLRFWSGTYTNTGGIISALDSDAVVLLQNATIIGGTLAGAGIIRGNNAVLNGVTNSAALVADPGAGLQLTGAFVNEASVTLEGNTVTIDGYVALGGGGTVAGSATINGMYQDQDLLYNADNTIELLGLIANLALVNESIIEASGAGVLELNPIGKLVRNAGTLRAGDGATLRLGPGSYDNGDGIIAAPGPGYPSVELYNAAIMGGTLTSTETGIIRCYDATLEGITNSAQLEVYNSVTLTGAFMNEENVALQGSTVMIDGYVTLAGIGSVTGFGGIRSENQGLLYNADNTIQLSGYCSDLAMLMNDGVIEGSMGSLVVMPSVQTLINNGVMGAASGELDIQADVFGTGRWTAQNGVLRFLATAATSGPIDIASNGSVQLLQGAYLSGSDLTLDATAGLSVDGTMALSGDVDFAMTSESDWSWSPGAVLTLTGGRPGGGDRNRLWVTLEAGGRDTGPGGTGVDNFGLRTFALAAQAHVALIDQRDNGNRNGPVGVAEAVYVETLTLGADAVLNLNDLHLYAAGQPVLPGPYGGGEVVDQPSTLVGDMNCDGTVDFVDINPFVLYLSNNAAWLTEFPGCPPENGDINGDGTYGQESFGDINPFVALLIGGG